MTAENEIIERVRAYFIDKLGYPSSLVRIEETHEDMGVDTLAQPR